MILRHHVPHARAFLPDGDIIWSKEIVALMGVHQCSLMITFLKHHALNNIGRVLGSQTSSLPIRCLSRHSREHPARTIQGRSHVPLCNSHWWEGGIGTRLGATAPAAMMDHGILAACQPYGLIYQDLSSWMRSGNLKSDLGFLHH